MKVNISKAVFDAIKASANDWTQCNEEREAGIVTWYHRQSLDVVVFDWYCFASGVSEYMIQDVNA